MPGVTERLPILTIVGWAAVAFGALFLLLGVGALVTSARRSKTWIRVPGRIVGSRLDSLGDSSSGFRYQVSFPFQGRTVTFWNRYTTSGGVDRTGAEVEVLVDPDNVNDAVVSRGVMGGQAVGVAFVVFGVVALVVGIILRLTS